MEPLKANVLGTDYEIILASEKEMPNELEDRDGSIDESIKTILVENYSHLEGNPHALKDRDFLIRKNIRHELVHAFLFESGLAENTTWAQNEEMVDWIARQFPKMLKAFEEVEAI